MNERTEEKQEQYDIKLIVMIWSICQKHKDTEQDTMALVETDMVIYTMWQKAHALPTKFIQLFKAQLDTTNENGGMAGYNTNIYKDNLTIKCEA